MDDEIRIMCKECYILRSSKAWLVSSDQQKRVSLTPTEYKILSILIDNQDRPVTREEIAGFIWGSNYAADRKDPESIKPHITRIRKKLDQIENGLGFKRIDSNDGFGSYTLTAKTSSIGSRPATEEPSLSCLFLRERDLPGDVFVPPRHFIVPQAPLQELLDSAFADSNIHAISGQRGMGKSELARYFSKVCCTGANCRKELQYNAVIWTTYSELGLKDTVARLSCTGETASSQQYGEKLRMLSRMKKPCLLVIDNYDNDTTFAEELSGSSQVYMDLLRCGCHILLTSKVNLCSCHAVRQTEIPPLPDRHLDALFWSLCEEEKTPGNQEKAAALIGKYLDRNTYLVILAAKLTETASLDEILKAFRELSVARMEDPVTAEKDGAKRPGASILAQYKTMFNLSSLQRDHRKTHLLYALSLLPVGGMPYGEFFEMAFPPEEQADIKLVFSQLRDSFWVFLRHRRVCIHPMVRELIVSEVKDFDCSYIRRFIRSLNSMNISNYTDRTCSDLELAEAAYDICKKFAVANLDTAVLVSNIAGIYDLFHTPEPIYRYSVQAIAQLKNLPSCISFDEKLAYATCCNVVGYAVLHAYDKPDSTALAEQMLLTAKDAVEELYVSNPEYSTVAYLLTENQGNLAALYLTKKDYDAALAMHSAALKVRRQLVQENPSPRAKFLLAAAYKGIATDYFYLSQKQNPHEKLSMLQLSLKYHQHSAALYEEVLSLNSLEASIANNRLVGSGITWLYAAAAISLPTDLQRDIDPLLDKTLAAARYLSAIRPIAHEISICISNAEKLATYLGSIGCAETDYMSKLKRIAGLIDGIASEKKAEWAASIRTIRRIATSCIPEETPPGRFAST
ncbi:MAG: winged helix-turn-helix domain-containing protein [Oscillospiraceae bacterium]|nr:winged helix-turn-helix domain-containing protein [Oscillospiraceae bacterium]